MSVSGAFSKSDVISSASATLCYFHLIRTVQRDAGCLQYEPGNHGQYAALEGKSRPVSFTVACIRRTAPATHQEIWPSPGLRKASRPITNTFLPYLRLTTADLFGRVQQTNSVFAARLLPDYVVVPKRSSASRDGGVASGLVKDPLVSASFNELLATACVGA